MSDKFQEELTNQHVPSTGTQSLDDISQELQDYIFYNFSNNPNIQVNVSDIDHSAFSLNISVTDSRPNFEFQGTAQFTLLITEEGTPLFLSLTDPNLHLEKVLTLVNQSIEEDPTCTIVHVLEKIVSSLPKKSTPFSSYNNPSASYYGQRKYRTPYQSLPESYFEKKQENDHLPEEDEEEPEDSVTSMKPTPTDWQDVILPEVDKALKREEFKSYEIEEWLRRINVNITDNLPKALDIVEYEIFYGQLPKKIKKYFVGSHRSKPSDNIFESTESTDEGNNANFDLTSFLRSEFKKLSKMDTKSQYGFSVSLISDQDLNHWKVFLYFDAHTKLGLQLQEFKLRKIFVSDVTEEIIQPLEMEVFFPSNFPKCSPFFRIIQPRLTKHSEIRLSQDINKSATQVNNNNNGSSQDQDRRRLSVSGLLETDHDITQGLNLMDLFHTIRKYCFDAEVDMESNEAFSHSTIGGFWKELKATPPSESHKLEHSGKIILPQSALIQLSSFDLENSHLKIHQRSSLQTSTGETSPMIFELSHQGKRTFVGVEEFTAPENHFICPQWILNNLGVSRPDSLVQVRRVKISSGKYLKIQPHHSDFLKVEDPKALLECVLPRYSVLSVGDSITINYFGQEFEFNILEVKPGRVIHLVDTDIDTDFEEPVDVIEERKKKEQEKQKKELQNSSEGPSTEKWKETSGQASGFVEHMEHPSGSDEYQKCHQCHRTIPSQNWELHSARCRGK